MYYVNLLCTDIKPVKNFVIKLNTDSSLVRDHRKFIMNSAIGMCGKKYNKRRETHTFKNQDDAYRFLKKNNGSIMQFDDGIWFHNAIKRQEINNGFYPIREMILDTVRMTMYETTKKMDEEGLIVTGFKTDAIFYQKPKKPINKYSISKLLHDSLGGGRIEENKLPPLFKNFVKYRETPKFQPPRQQIMIEMEDEYDINESNSKIQNMTLVMADAGVGKSWAAFNYAKSKYQSNEILGVAPWNAQALNIRHNHGIVGVTFCSLVGRVGIRKYNACNVDNIKAIIIDEIMLLTLHQIMVLAKYMEAHPHIEFLATGDPFQLEAIGDQIDNHTKEMYIRQMFAHGMHLHENKRLVLQEDKDKLKQIKKALFVDKWSVKRVINAFFKDHIIDKLGNEAKAYTYYRETAEIVNHHIHGIVPHDAEKFAVQCGDTKYYIGERVICKYTMKLKYAESHPNFVYTILSHDKNIITLEDVLTKEKLELKTKYFDNYFHLPYANTVHSSQGAKCDEPFVICDAFDDMMTSNWFYTAITRAVRFTDIKILNKTLSQHHIVRSIKKMIMGYKNQDQKAGRQFNELEYVDIPWVYHRIDASDRCRGCGLGMTFESGNQKITVQRKNSALPHTKENCELLCLSCNRAAKNIPFL